MRERVRFGCLKCAVQLFVNLDAWLLMHTCSLVSDAATRNKQHVAASNMHIVSCHTLVRRLCCHACFRVSDTITLLSLRSVVTMTTLMLCFPCAGDGFFHEAVHLHAIDMRAKAEVLKDRCVQMMVFFMSAMRQSTSMQLSGISHFDRQVQAQAEVVKDGHDGCWRRTTCPLAPNISCMRCYGMRLLTH
jgi:hypothetical protein